MSADADVLSPLGGQSPMDVVMDGLLKQARGEEIDDEEHDRLEYAMTLLAATSLVNAGGDIDSVLRQFEDREHVFRASYDRATGDVSIEVEWLDGGDES